ncbi:MAG: hypothetical protein A2Z38_11660 [Planctomycetes bacterium RBG_19FT_COMBO_48_8]|nr:MAG: hypothetical protein A2Z38_11660 [Planctomycetes bacterium RBG_19FT_COMBO_48_8]
MLLTLPFVVVKVIRKVLLPKGHKNQGRKPAFRGEQLQNIDNFVKKHSDATLEEIRAGPKQVPGRQITPLQATSVPLQ